MLGNSCSATCGRPIHEVWRTHRLKTMRGTSGTPRHTKRSRYRCSLPGLAGFTGNRCTEPEVPRIGRNSARSPQSSTAFQRVKVNRPISQPMRSEFNFQNCARLTHHWKSNARNHMRAHNSSGARARISAFSVGQACASGDEMQRSLRRSVKRPAYRGGDFFAGNARCQIFSG
jgi:hypothetical protein